MCWKGNFELKTAQKDFEVYKVMKVGLSNSFFSAYKNFAYEEGHTYHSEIIKIPFYYKDISAVNVALHSYSLELTEWEQKNGVITIISKKRVKEEDILDFFINNINDFIVVPCLIPKGAKYCINELGEIISDTLQVL
jgi:phage terminase large subunit-like protein